ncbi:MAG: hypothetical protein VX298_00800, partial [Pseudomonadota bacterium]|nr:hypothetical protein [Pseudomonadota bacterium]
SVRIFLFLEAIENRESAGLNSNGTNHANVLARTRGTKTIQSAAHVVKRHSEMLGIGAAELPC